MLLTICLVAGVGKCFGLPQKLFQCADQLSFSSSLVLTIDMSATIYLYHVQPQLELTYFTFRFTNIDAFQSPEFKVRICSLRFSFIRS